LAQVRAKIADLQRMADTLADTAARCAGGRAARCPILESLAVPPGERGAAPKKRLNAS
jgi:MerR family mercuric resistance operon transcriptional regulator